MSSSKQYRAKAAEYDERSRNTGVLSEIVEYKNLGRRFTELADNEDWVERNFKKTLHVPGDDQDAGGDAEDKRNFKKTLHVPGDDQDAGGDAEDKRILRCLGASVILHWNKVPRKLQKDLFDSAAAMGDLPKTKALRAEIARFLHAHKDDRRTET